MSVTLLLEAGYVALRRFRIAVDLVLAVCMLVQEMASKLLQLRALSHKGATFVWDSSHGREFEQLMSNFGRLELLEPYDPNRDLCALTDASYMGLAFILFQKREGPTQRQ